MAPAKTTKANSSISTNSFEDDFGLFNDPNYREGIQQLSTLQPLLDTRDELAYLGIRESDLKTCKWTAKEADFEKGTVLWNRTHFFDGGDREIMHCFTAPRLQIIHSSEILVIDNSITDRKGKSMNTIVGDFSMEHIAEAFKAEKKAAENSKPRRQSKYTTRRKYLVNILTKDNELAHEVPIVLTLSATAGRMINNALMNFYKDMDKCMSMAQNLGAAAKYNDTTHAIYVFSPKCTIQKEKNELTQKPYSFLSVDSVLSPEYNDQESAQREVYKLTVPKDTWNNVWSQKKDEMLADYINKHSRQASQELAGRYGIADGVPALKPQGTVEVLPPALGDRDETGALVGGLK